MCILLDECVPRPLTLVPTVEAALAGVQAGDDVEVYA